ncbi:protein of unknown function (plasmid) [Cupriavidus taiwanensis]|uniref:Uncharacterized protein n=1 Tax=Cupriavidus taiwanensis TaxID=164546 RepID=A0A375FIQ5_9BURK|nr:protein of unknown function [Cupriavidus taiwanensis]SOZ72362.1 protein of unknown function [Cupriavidus taiwanensis]SOZ74680.1 protein of unknown function [Cupriavidus taiwanensis]SPA03567.1 protein of unknown function [Cupriavidus taiwanensis]SPA11466.1 protein of unknown function [Cupriavidus taiwanensis]
MRDVFRICGPAISNGALQHSTGELIAMFDADHASRKDFLIKSDRLFSKRACRVHANASRVFSTSIHSIIVWERCRCESSSR